MTGNLNFDISYDNSVRKEQRIRIINRLWEDISDLMSSYIDPMYSSFQNDRELSDRLSLIMREFYETFANYYGPDNAQRFINHLYRFLVSGMEVVQDMYYTQQFEVETSLNEWYQAADQLAAFLTQINNKWWINERWIEYLYLYINYLLELTRAVLRNDRRQADNIYRNIQSTINRISGYMTSGFMGLEAVK